MAVTPDCLAGQITNTGAPSVSVVGGGTPYVGTTLQTTNGTWSACGSTISGYHYQWLRNGSTISGATSSSYTIPSGNANVGASFKSEVQACDDLECSSYVQSSNSEVTVDRPPSAPSSLSPANGAVTGTTPTLSSTFSDPDGQTGYVHYMVFRCSDNASVASGNGSTVASGSRSTWTTSPALAAGNCYYWQAYAVDNSGETSSTVGSPAVYVPPSVPQLGSPAGGAQLATATPVLSASSSSAEPIYYEFQVASDSGFANVVADSGWVPTTSTWTVPLGVLQDGATYYWQVRAADSDGVSSNWSSSTSFNIHLPKLGARGYWPIWSHGPLAVNEANGNLVVSAPGPSYPTATGSMGASLTYNSQSSMNDGLGTGWALTVGDGRSSPPAELIDHSVSGASPQFDAVERVSADGSSDYYTQVGSASSGTPTNYLSAAGDGSRLTKNADGTWTLLDPDGSIYTFNRAGSNGVATLKSAEQVDAAPGKGALTYTYSTAQPTEIKSISDDGGRTLSFAWANASDTGTCSGAILCVTGPDSVTWKYIGDGSGGTSGRLVTVNDGTRNLLQIGYGSNGLVNSIRNANDLDPSHASPNYNGSHALTVSYDTNSPNPRVVSVSDGPVTNQTPSTSTWSFSYHPGAIEPTPPRASHYGYLVRNNAPLAYYPLDETSGTTATDASGNSNNAAYSGGYTLGQAGALAGSGGGTAVTFSGGTVSGSIPNLNTSPGGYTTVELWVNWDGTNAVMPFGFNGYDLFFYNGFFGFNTGCSNVYGTTAPSANSWHYVVAEFYNGNPANGAELWIDGAKQTLSLETGSNCSGTVSSSFDISGWPNDGNYRLHGSVDAVAIYSYQLAPDQIAADYAEGRHNRTADGYTTLTPPNQQGQACPSSCVTTYYDSLGHPIETVDILGHITESFYNQKNELLWSEDADGNPTDYLYGGPDGKPTANPSVADALLQTVGPDPDGSGPLQRPVTRYRYDETQVGTAQAAGPSLTGLQASYYENTSLAGRATTIENDPNVDYSWPNGPTTQLPGYNFSSGFSVRWSGDLLVSVPGSYTFSTPSTTQGTRLTIDGVRAIDNWASPYSATSSQPVTLSAGLHSLVLEYFDSSISNSPQVQLDWACSGCSPSLNQEVIPSASLLPSWLNQTSTISPAGRLSFSHYANPATGLADYSLVQPQSGPPPLITSYSYDADGRLTQQVMPNGNAGRAIDSQGNLQGTPNTTYAISYTYYAATETAQPPNAPDCSGSLVNQSQQLKTITVHGDATTTYVYDSAGRQIAKTNGAGTTCSTYNSEGRLTSSQAPGDSTPTTFTYDPAGAQLTASGPTGTVTTYYDEQGRLVDTIDANGAEAKYSYDPDGNQLTRSAATGSLSGNTDYTTSYRYNAADQLTGETDPAGNSYSFYYDNRGNLRGTQYPNGTFSWVDTNPDGWISDQYNRHGTINASTTTPPADSSPLADFTYTYDQDGKRLSEIRKSGSASQTTSYSYDNLGRLSQVILPNGTCRNYSYDLDSNRTQIQESSSGCNGPFTTTASYTYDPTTTPGLDELTKTVAGGTTTNYSYTSDGQTSSQGTTSYTWDGWGRLRTATVGSNTITYTYNPTGSLKTRTSSSPATTLNYLLGDLFETTSSGTITTSYTDGPAGDLASYAGPPTSTSSVTYLYYDAHGNLAAEASSSGSQTGNHTYDPFGTPTDTTPSNTTIHRYVGRWNKQYDTTTGLILMGARPYNPTTGRFLSVDPIPNGSLNTYDYAGQDPINGYDLNGTCSKWWNPFCPAFWNPTPPAFVTNIAKSIWNGSKHFFDTHKRLVACVSFAAAIALPLADAAVTARAVYTAARDAGESAGAAEKLAAGFRAATKAQRGKFNFAAASGSVGSFLLSQATGGCF